MASFKKRLAAVAAAVGLTIGLGGCMGDYGYGGVGYASSYYDDYGYGGYGPSYAYGSPYGGWYNNFYYPGTGVYVFDRGGRRTRWNDGQRRYWEGRRGNWQGQRGRWQGDRAVRPWRERRVDRGQPGYVRPEGAPRGRGEGWRGQRRGDRPAAQGYSGGQWRGRGEARMGATPRGPRIEGRGMGGPGRWGGRGNRQR